MTKWILFGISYIFIVMSLLQILLYMNYFSLGYRWQTVWRFIIQTPDFALFVGSFIVLTFIVFYPGPSRSPFF